MLRACLLTLVSVAPVFSGLVFESLAIRDLNIGGQSTPIVGNPFTTQWVGVRFTISQATLITAVGGYMVANPFANSKLFAAIVPLNGPDDFPTGLNFSPIATSTFLPSLVLSDVMAPLNTVLSPGVYCLIFGVGSFGSPIGGEASMPWGILNSNSISSSYFSWTSVSLPVIPGKWQNSALNLRFFVEGTALPGSLAVPEPSMLICCLASLACLWRKRLFDTI